MFPNINPVWHLLQRLLWLLLGAFLCFLRFFLGFLWAWLRTRRCGRWRCRWCNSFADLRFWPRQIQGQQYHESDDATLYSTQKAHLRIQKYVRRIAYKNRYAGSIHTKTADPQNHEVHIYDIYNIYFLLCIRLYKHAIHGWYKFGCKVQLSQLDTFGAGTLAIYHLAIARGVAARSIQARACGAEPSAMHIFDAMVFRHQSV